MNQGSGDRRRATRERRARTIMEAARQRMTRRALENTAVYRVLRRIKRRLRARIESRALRRKVLEGYRLVPESELEACYRMVLQRLCAGTRPGQLGDYLEFGVYHGASLACMYRALDSLSIAQVRLFGFDSFAGLPAEADTDAGGWRPGQYASSLRFTRRFLTRAGVDWTRVILVKGWFRDVLTDALIARYGIRKASVIMVDCDIYSSARQALDFCGPLIRDRAAILFDDWRSGGDLAARNQGEKRAFDEFLADNPDLTATALPAYAPNAAVFMVMRRGAGASGRSEVPD